MGVFDRLFVQEEENTKGHEKGGNREVVEAQQNEPNYALETEKVDVSGSAAEDILKNALAPLEGKEPTVYTLKELVSALPPGSKKEAILGVLSVTRVSVEAIKQDGQKRIGILDSVEKKLQKKVSEDISQFESEIKEAENRIEENRRKKAESEDLLRKFQLLKSEKTDEVKDILATIE